MPPPSPLLCSDWLLRESLLTRAHDAVGQAVTTVDVMCFKWAPSSCKTPSAPCPVTRLSCAVFSLKPEVQQTRPCDGGG